MENEQRGSHRYRDTRCMKLPETTSRTPDQDKIPRKVTHASRQRVTAFAVHDGFSACRVERVGQTFSLTDAAEFNHRKLNC